MIIKFENIKENAGSMMRRAGYALQRREGDEMSFVRVLARSGYPRFHAYVHMEGMHLVVNIHIDNKRETYGENTRHHGEYENSPALEQEVARIRQILA